MHLKAVTAIQVTPWFKIGSSGGTTREVPQKSGVRPGLKTSLQFPGQESKRMATLDAEDAVDMRAIIVIPPTLKRKAETAHEVALYGDQVVDVRCEILFL